MSDNSKLQEALELAIDATTFELRRFRDLSEIARLSDKENESLRGMVNCLAGVIRANNAQKSDAQMADQAAHLTDEQIVETLRTDGMISAAQQLGGLGAPKRGDA